MSKHYIYTILILLSCLLLCQCSNNNQSKSNDRSDYVQRARKQDSLRIAHYQDSVEKASLTVIAQKEKEEAERVKAEQERKKQEEAKRVEERRVAEEQAKRVAEEKKKYTGTLSGHEYVDLGLSAWWATCNVGASSPSEYGSYFAWGETTSKWDFENTYTLNDSPNIGKDISGTKYDAANVNWGNDWCMPTKSQWEELISKCSWEWTTQSNHKGWKITGPSGQSIFLPAAGWYLGKYGNTIAETYCKYWSSTLSYEYSFNAYAYDGQDRDMDDYATDYGMTIRPVVSSSGKKLAKIDKQLQSYDELVSEEAKKAAPTFGLR